MSKTTREDRKVSSPVSSPRAAPSRFSAQDVLILAIWCGLAAGLLEVATRISCRFINPTNRVYQVSRHFVWLAPLSYLLFFFGMGLLMAAATRLWRRRGSWLSPRLILASALLPSLIVAGPGIYYEAWFILALGIASRLVPLLERDSTRVRRWLVWTFPGLLGLVVVMAGSVFARDWVKERREASRPLPPPDSPNVLLIVLDTVRADHMSLYGYPRTTTPNLERLAKLGIRFEDVRATAPWTLPSHASIFTGRWPHELGVEWMTPLNEKFPTLAEYLGSHGYATAGFVANTLFCSYDTGIDRGFTHYEDYVLGPISALRTAYLVDLNFKWIFAVAAQYGTRFDAGPLRPLQEFVLGWILERDRISGESISRKFVEWLTGRQEPNRPFFAFLNYFDAHSPYVLPLSAAHRFGLQPRSMADVRVLDGWRELNKLELSPYHRILARDSYDNCLAYLDEQLGELFNELHRRGVLDRTLIIVTADHGEGLGEHDLFDHGESLYRTEIGVPLLIVAPSRGHSQGVVKELVSLRNLPATIVDLVGLEANSPFPGPSLANLWRKSSPDPGSVTIDGVISELTGPNPSHPNQARSPAERGPLISLAEGDFVYIRNEGDGAEELFNERDDPSELRNRAADELVQPILKRLRDRLNQLRADPASRIPLAGMWAR
jgi:arylsulfatase A-like enzyme